MKMVVSAKPTATLIDVSIKAPINAVKRVAEMDPIVQDAIPAILVPGKII